MQDKIRWPQLVHSGFIHHRFHLEDFTVRLKAAGGTYRHEKSSTNLISPDVFCDGRLSSMYLFLCIKYSSSAIYMLYWVLAIVSQILPLEYLAVCVQENLTCQLLCLTDRTDTPKSLL
jgi:hypothetical protein